MYIKLKFNPKLFFLGSALASPSLLFGASVQFETPSGPPPGFEDSELNVTQTNYISLYYGNTFLGNVMGTYDNSTVDLGDVSKLVANIPGIIDPQKVAAALQGKLPTNAENLCSGSNPSQKPYCSIINPEVAGVIFDANHYRATVFVNPKYLATEDQGNLRPTIADSTAGFSYIANNVFSVASSTGSQNYSLNNISLFGKGNNVVNVTSNLSQLTGSSVSSSSVYTLQTVDLTRFKNGLYYQMGMFTPQPGGAFLGGPTVLGVSVQNFGILNQAAQGNPIQVYLPLPAQVAVYKNGYLISTQSFNAGKQQLDTSSFPEGSYELTLKITNNIGQITTQNVFFVKQSSLPPTGSPNYQASIGVLQSNTTNPGGNGVILPNFTSVPLFSYGQLRRLGSDFGLQSSLMTTFDRAYLAETLNYYGESWMLSPGVLVSNNQQYGWLLNAVFTPISLPSFQFTSNNQKILNSNSNSSSSSSNITASNYTPVSQTSIQSTNTITWMVNPLTNIDASESYTKEQGGAGTVQYGLTLSRTLFSNELLSFQLTGSMIKSTGQTPVFSLQLSSSFNTIYNINVGLGVGYGNANTITNENGSTYNVYKPFYSESVSKSSTWGPNNANSLITSANFNQGFTSNNNNYQLSYTSQLMQAEFNYSQNSVKQYTNVGGALQSTSQSFNQLSGNILNNITITAGGIASGYQGGNQSGIMADVQAPEPTTADVYINGVDYGAVKSNVGKAFFLPGYQTYDVTIQPNGMTQYGFDSKPKTVVIYNGNMALLKWTLTKQYVLFAQIVDENNKPLSNMLMVSTNPNEFNTTDDNGYIQANLPENATSISFQSISGDKCTVSLNPSKINQKDKNDLVVLDKPLVCEADKS